MCACNRLLVCNSNAQPIRALSKERCHQGFRPGSWASFKSLEFAELETRCIILNTGAKNKGAFQPV